MIVDDGLSDRTVRMSISCFMGEFDKENTIMGRGQSIKADEKSIHEDFFLPEKDPEFGFCIYDNIDDSAFGDSAAFAHRHPFYEIVFIEDADGAHIIDYTAYDDLKNVVFLISPGQVHYWKNVTRAKGILIYFQEEFLFQSSISVSSVWEFQLFKEMVEMPAIYMDEDFAQTMRAVCRMMLKEYESKSPDYAQVLRACLNILLIYFHRRHREIAHQGIERTPGMAGKLHLRLQNLID
ncbi:hypothetical protein D1151_01570 [Emergencia sp. 1XD21-10]|nr:hypothetical protein [Emergencia sp. 1XD21-10]